ncbi:Ornithine decarboxylase [Mycoemilia scoparia]|uniref:Ornithine decarboxylase n=1 Tax=Mycoemilia scoparia TaxID=417184 RepID=A0A9W7ZWQ8_9FUNG|nr:Ornithine decarboxylase [Mycoemilia scoparia]
MQSDSSPTLVLPPMADHQASRLYMVQEHDSNARYAAASMLSPAATVSKVVGERAVHGNCEDPFFVADIGEITRQLNQWKSFLPRVEPFYAVKCNPDHRVVSSLASMNTGFDCASRAEIRQMLDLGVSPDRIIYAHPCKPASHLRFAAENGVDMMTFDNEDELHKIRRLAPNAKAVIRILTDDSKSLCKLGLKFGTPLTNTQYLLETAKSLGINVVGVSFHVGSGCLDENAFADAVSRARYVFDQGKALGFNFTLLDVGGGFPGNNEQSGVTFPKVAKVLNQALNQHFPDTQEDGSCETERIRIIAEPGRYFVASAFNLAVNVVARRVVAESPDEIDASSAFMYYVNDGVYGSFNCIMFDHQVVYPEAVTCNGQLYDSRNDCGANSGSSSSSYECSIWGPTCDSIDCIVPKTDMPELNVGDWLLFRNMGAYTLCAASQFNGFEKSTIVYIDTEN